jgi:hypothetical protein
MNKVQFIRSVVLLLLTFCIRVFSNAQTPWRFVLPDSFLYQMNFDFNKPATINAIKKTSSQCRWFRTVNWNKDTFLYSGIGSSNTTSISDSSLDFRIVNFNNSKSSNYYTTKFNAYPFFNKDCEGNLRLNYNSDISGYYNKVFFKKDLTTSDTLNYFYEFPNYSWGFLRFDQIARINKYYYTKNFEIHTYQGSELIYINDYKSFGKYKDTVTNFGVDCGFLGNSYLSHDGKTLIRTAVGGLSKYGPVNNDEIVVCDFNAQIGQISNRKSLLNVSQVNTHFTSSFAQFSGNDSFIWVVMSQHGSLNGSGVPYPKTYPLIWQFNRYNGSIYKHFTKTIIPPKIRDANVICTFDQGPDGRIYFLWLDAGKNGGNFHIGCISNPNNWGKDVVIYDSLLSIPNKKFPNFSLRSFLEYGVNSLGESDEPVWWFEGEQVNYGNCEDSALFSIGLDTSVYARIIFGDGDSLDLGYCAKNRNYIKHKYKKGGKYTAFLRIFGKDCYAHWINRNIPVAIYPPLIHNAPTITEVPSCTDYSLFLTDSLTKPSLIHINWGNGMDTSFLHIGKLNLTQSISNQDTIALKYTLSDSNQCVWDYQQNLIAKFLPSTNHTASVFPLEVCEGGRLQVFSFGSNSVDSIAIGYNTLWMNSSVLDTSTLNAQYGQDSIRIHFYNSYGCFKDSVLYIKVKIAPEATLITDDTTCVNSPSNAFLEGIKNVDSVRWQGSNWQPFNIAVENEYTFADSGFTLFTAFLKNNNGCQDTLSNAIYSHAMPKVTLKKPVDLICTQKAYPFEALSSSGTFYEWSIRGNTISNQASFVFTFTDTGEFVLNCKVSNPFGCITNDSIAIMVNEGVDAAFYYSDSAFCAGSRWYARANISKTVSRWNWNGNNYQDSTFVLSPVATSNLVGKFIISHSKLGLNSCVDTVSKEIVIYEKPHQSIVISSPACTNDPIMFTNIYKNVQWIIENKTLYGDTITYQFLDSGVKNILSVASDTNHCSDSTWKNITVLKSPSVQIRISGAKFDAQLGYGYAMETTPTSFSKYSWFLNGVESSNEFRWYQYFNIAETIQPIRLEVSDSRGCKASFDTLLRVLGLTKFIFPTAISANSDGVNEGFGIAGPEYVKNYKIWIFNRWGEVVFYTENPNALWIPENAIFGEYVYKAIIQDIYSRWQEAEGVFMVLK